MTQPIFGATSFEATPQPTPQDAFDLITGEVLQNAREQFPERSFLWDENVQAVADRLNDRAWTMHYKERMMLGYVGKWIIVSFNLGDHRSRFGMEIVTAEPPANVPLRYGLTAIFDTEPWAERLATYCVYERLTCMGQIEQLNVNEIRLRNCEIV